MHWLETVLTLAEGRIKAQDAEAHIPKIGLLRHCYFAHASKQEISNRLGTSITIVRILLARIDQFIQGFQPRMEITLAY